MKNKIIIFTIFIFTVGVYQINAQRKFVPNLKTLYPDLIIKTVSVSGDKQKITVTAANICKGRSKATTVRIAFRQKSGEGKGQIKFETDGDIPALRENESSYEIVLDISSFASGQDFTQGNDIFSVELVVDPQDKVKELDETNNREMIYTHTKPPTAQNHCDRRT